MFTHARQIWVNEPCYCLAIHTANNFSFEERLQPSGFCEAAYEEVSPVRTQYGTRAIEKALFFIKRSQMAQQWPSNRKKQG